MRDQVMIYRDGSPYAEVDGGGRIKRLDGMNGGFSDTWRVTGAVQYNNFGRVARIYTLAEVLKGDGIAWYYLNGRQRTFLRDVDHGTPREWRNPRHYVRTIPVAEGSTD